MSLITATNQSANKTISVTKKLTIITSIILILIAISGLAIYNNKPKLNTQNSLVKKNCDRVNRVNNKPIDPKIIDQITDRMINEWFDSSYEYTKTIPRQDKLFAIFNLYVESGGQDNLMELYAQAIEREDYRIVRLLSNISIPSGVTKKYFN